MKNMVDKKEVKKMIKKSDKKEEKKDFISKTNKRL